MTETASQDKQMPYGVTKRQPLIRVKQHSETVKQAPCQKPRDRSERQCLDHRLNCNDYEPTHSQINNVRKNFESFYMKRLEHNSKHRQAPDNAEQTPTPSSSECHQHERRVGARNQNVNSGVIHNFKYVLGTLLLQGVIKQGSHIKQAEACA